MEKQNSEPLVKNPISRESKNTVACCTPKDNGSPCCLPGSVGNNICCEQPSDGSICCNK